LFLGTGLSSEERDLINGATPDVFIALKGGAGTLCELGFALAAKKGVLFVDSIEALGEVFRRESATLKCNFDKALKKYPALPAFGVTTERLMKRVQCTLGDRRNEIGNEATIIKQAINLAHRWSLGETGFPGLPSDPESRAKFEKFIEHLAG
jgi:hypothetical protein